MVSSLNLKFLRGPKLWPDFLYTLLTFTSSSFSLNIGKLCRCSNNDFFSFLPYEAFCPPDMCFFHSGRSWGICPTPLILAASCRPSALRKRHQNYQFANIYTRYDRKDLCTMCNISLNIQADWSESLLRHPKFSAAEQAVTDNTLT